MQFEHVIPVLSISCYSDERHSFSPAASTHLHVVYILDIHILVLACILVSAKADPRVHPRGIDDMRMRHYAQRQHIIHSVRRAHILIRAPSLQLLCSIAQTRPLSLDLHD